MLPEWNEVGELDQARPVRLELAAQLLGDMPRRGARVEVLGGGWPEDQARAKQEVDARSRRYPEEVEEHVGGEGDAHVLQQGIVDGEVGADAHDRDGESQGAAQEEVDPARVPHVAPGKGVVQEEVAEDAQTHGE